MDLIQENISKTLRSLPRPYKGFSVGVMAMDDGAYWLIVYENEIMMFNDSQRADILLYLEQVKFEIEKSGVRVEIGGQPGDPPKGGNHGR